MENNDKNVQLESENLAVSPTPDLKWQSLAAEPKKVGEAEMDWAPAQPSETTTVDEPDKPIGEAAKPPAAQVIPLPQPKRYGLAETDSKAFDPQTGDVKELTITPLTEAGANKLAILQQGGSEVVDFDKASGKVYANKQGGWMDLSEKAKRDWVKQYLENNRQRDSRLPNSPDDSAAFERQTVNEYILYAIGTAAVIAVIQSAQYLLN